MATRARSRTDDSDPEQLLDLFGTPLIDCLGAEESETRECAARALCSLAGAEPSLVDSLAHRLLGRIADADDRSSVVRTLATLADAHPDAVRAALVDRDAPRSLQIAVVDGDGWAFDTTRSNGVEQSETRRGTSDRRSDGGTDVATLVQQVVDVAEGSSATTTEPTAPDRESGVDSPIEPPTHDQRTGPDTPDSAAISRRERIQRAESSRVFRAIALLGEFDDISVVEPEQAVRYGSAIRTRATIDGREHGVAVRLFDLPESGEPRREFAAAVAERLAEWDGVDDHDGVLAVHDWGDHPRPWVATRFVDGSLADRGRVPVARGLREAAHLARAVEYCHRNGVVHAGLDPTTVVYPDASLDGLPAPRLDNVGLMTPIRRHFDPSSYLDPRYAAPEYFDRSYGVVDQSTDVYQLGATLYRLFTGRAPFSGSYDVVREAVLEDHPPDPSRVADLPSELDPVFAKALAKNKLTRYESVTALRIELESVLERLS